MSYGYPPGGGYGGPPQGGGYGGPPPGYGAPPPGYAPQQQPYGQQPYAPPQAPYGAGPGIHGQPMPVGQARQQHPQAMTALILGGVAWFLGLWLICSVPAWIIGAKALREIRANPHLYTGESEAKIGMWLGIVHTVFGALAILAAIAFFILFAAAATVG